MKKTLSFLCIILSFSCDLKEDKIKFGEPSAENKMLGKILKPTFDSVFWNKKITNKIASFLLESNCHDCINELYIDKILPDYILITLKSRSYFSGYIKENNPLFVSKINGHNFYIYSGIENVLIGDKKNMQIKGDTSSNSFTIWTLIVLKDSVKVNKFGSPPFFPSEDVKPENVIK